MKKKLLFVAAMAVLLMGAFSSCGKKATPLEKIVKETSDLLPMEDSEFVVTSLVCKDNHVSITYDANEVEAEFVDYFIDQLNDCNEEEWEQTKAVFYPELLAYHFDSDVLAEMMEAGAGLTVTFKNDASGKSKTFDITAEEIAACADIVKMMRDEVDEPVAEEE